MLLRLEYSVGFLNTLHNVNIDEEVSYYILVDKFLEFIPRTNYQKFLVQRNFTPIARYDHVNNTILVYIDAPNMTNDDLLTFVQNPIIGQYKIANNYYIDLKLVLKSMHGCQPQLIYQQ